MKLGLAPLDDRYPILELVEMLFFAGGQDKRGHGRERCSGAYFKQRRHREEGLAASLIIAINPDTQFRQGLQSAQALLQ